MSAPTLKDSDLLRSFLALQRSSYLGIVIADTTRFVQMNDTFLNMLGLKRDDTLPNGIEWRGLTPENHAKSDEAALTHLKTHGAFPPYEKEFLHKDGRKVAVVVAGMRLSAEPLTWASYVMEVSLGKRLEEMENANRALEEKNRTLNELAQRVSNPLAVVSSFLDVVSKDASASEEIQGLLDPARRALDKASQAAKEMR